MYPVTPRKCASRCLFALNSRSTEKLVDLCPPTSVASRVGQRETDTTAASQSGSWLSRLPMMEIIVFAILIDRYKVGDGQVTGQDRVW
jgi:hypothetical protein